MKKVIFCLTVLLAFLPNAICQDNSFGGSITPEDLKLRRYDKDPSAEAVILSDIGESVFYDTEGGYDIRFTRTCRVKVFTEAGIKYATINIPFYHNDSQTETIRSIAAISYNLENGQIVQNTLDPKTIYEEVKNERWKVKKFVIPGVKPGTIFEFKYILETPFQFNLPDWKFQSSIPTVISSYVVGMIPFYQYAFIVQGTNKLDIQTANEGKVSRTHPSLYVDSFTDNSFRDMVYTFGMKDVPAFRDESYITSPEDYIMKIDFQLSMINYPRGGSMKIMSTWPEMIDEFLKSEAFGNYIKRCKKYTENGLKELNLSAQASEEEKCKAIIQYVKSNLKWNENYGKYTIQNPRELLTEKKGNAAEINLFMIAMLNEAGINAAPLILSTRDNGKIKTTYPFESFFNYVIASVSLNNKTVLADGTEPKLAWNRIPTRCINEKGLLIKEGTETWINLTENSISNDDHNIEFEPDPDSLTAKVNLIITADEFDAYYYRSTFNNDSATITNRLEEDGFTAIHNLQTSNFADVSKPYLINVKGETDLESLDNKIVITPFLKLPIGKNLLTQNTRTYPIDMIYSSANSYKSSIRIPSGYKISFVPEDFFMDNDLMTISLKYETKGDTLEATGVYTFKKAVYKASDFTKMKYYINLVVDKFNDQVVFESI